MVGTWGVEGKIEGWKRREKERKKKILNITDVDISLCLYASSNVVE